MLCLTAAEYNSETNLLNREFDIVLSKSQDQGNSGDEIFFKFIKF